MNIDINVIVAYSDNFIIGNNKDIPWKYDEDLKYFKNITTYVENKNKKNVVIMGNNTFISLNNKPLKNRINMVLTTKRITSDTNDTNNSNDTDQSKELYFYNALCDCIDKCKELLYDDIIEKIFIIGGESIYEYFFKSYYYRFLNKVYITRIYKNYEGNKYFYGLESKFYYKNINKSIAYPELEYRVLQYDSKFKNPELHYLNQLKIMISNNIMVSHDEYNVQIDLNYYFPLFSFISDVDSTFNTVFDLLNDLNIIQSINLILQKDTDTINLENKIYKFVFSENKLSLNVSNNNINFLNEYINDLLLSSLVLLFISKLMNLKADIINYTCNKYYIKDNDMDKIEEIAWLVPDVLPLIKINGDQNKIEDFKYENLEILGHKI